MSCGYYSWRNEALKNFCQNFIIFSTSRCTVEIITMVTRDVKTVHAVFYLSLPGVNDIMMCRGAAAFLIAVVNRKPEIDSFDEGGIKPSELKGKIAFNNVKFAYPTRRNMLILKGVTFTVNQGETVALVGHSGCGKSTTVSLVQRFYNPDAGERN